MLMGGKIGYISVDVFVIFNFLVTNFEEMA